jgi:GntR family transcriptional repressor for pyruvate dehydrogenase complex
MISSCTRIIKSVTQKIDDGTLVPGQKTYGAEEFADMLNVSREDIRSALPVMRFLGFVTEQNEGRYLISSLEDREAASFPLEAVLSFTKNSSQDLFELRRALEIENAVNAAQRATDEEIQEIKNITEEMEQTDFSEKSFESIHRRFHLHIAACSGNIISYRLLGSVLTLIHQEIADTYAELPDSDKETVRRSHRDICRALEERRSGLVQELMRQHMDFEPLIEMMHRS